LKRFSVGLVLLTAACGSSFQASDASGGGSSSSPSAGSGAIATAGAGAAGNSGGDTGSADGGNSTSSGTGGVASGAAGAFADGGAMTGGSTSAAGKTGSNGGSSGDTSSGGSVGASGSMNAGGMSAAGANNGGAPSGGGGGAPDCASLQNTYLNDLAKAQQCDPAALKAQCSTDSTLPGACECPVLVAAGTAATMKARADFKTFNDAGCKLPSCAAACIQYSSAACLASSGGGYACTGALSTNP